MKQSLFLCWVLLAMILVPLARAGMDKTQKGLEVFTEKFHKQNQKIWKVDLQFVKKKNPLAFKFLEEARSVLHFASLAPKNKTKEKLRRLQAAAISLELEYFHLFALTKKGMILQGKHFKLFKKHVEMKIKTSGLPAFTAKQKKLHKTERLILRKLQAFQKRLATKRKIAFRHFHGKGL